MKTHALPNLLQICQQTDKPKRVAIVYSMMSLDSFFVLPYTMQTFNECRQIQVRFFAFEHFFPFFYGHIERKFPLIFILDDDGVPGQPWGPRVETDSQGEEWTDETLSQFAIKNYPAALDDSLSRYFSRYLSLPNT